MTDNHPITPSIELVKQWSDHWHRADDNDFDHALFISIRAARWGADQELEACCEWLAEATPWAGENWVAEKLRKHRRPKPPSLKEQALKELAWVDKNLNMPLLNQCDAIHTIRRAIEALPD